ncbi:phosphopantetheine-binding protein [Kitasatospora sp. NPDC017646]|uniref:phosphopantetheine-binding protein n=1 Tax=Kitasatospora sp. NPDC017646 TaxID=3364024 RepID=UPI0037A4939B
MTLHGHSTDSAVQPPETPPGARSLDELRAVITRIWQDVLRLEDLTAEDNFFELGGHSLTASQVISRMAQALRVEVPLAAFFDHPTVAELAAFTAAAQQAGAQTGVQ